MAKYFSSLVLATVVILGLAMSATAGDNDHEEHYAAYKPSSRFFWLRPGFIPWIPLPGLTRPTTAAPATTAAPTDAPPAEGEGGNGNQPPPEEGAPEEGAPEEEAPEE